MQGILRLHPGVVFLRKNGAHEGTVRGPVLVEHHMMLLAVEDLDEDVLVVRAPADAGEVPFVGEFSGDDGAEHVAEGIADEQADMLRGHTYHRIAYLPEAARAGGDVQERELVYRGFILAVHRQQLSGRGGKDSSVYAEFIA